MIRLTGQDRDQVTPDPFLRSVFADGEQASRLLADVLSGRQDEWSGELVVRRARDQALPVLVRVNAVVDGEGRRLGAGGSAH